ncbi:Rap1a/Tai family immunity protein [Sphingosinithalassobacter sp. LHW66-3]|uniref:Rap1a/Tai family immunity protein n=1 Tax=Sphingosinithalassobacter sp. LHW66-3 TaxID=3424718 RepID=UPI003D6A5E61
MTIFRSRFARLLALAALNGVGMAPAPVFGQDRKADRLVTGQTLLQYCSATAGEPDYLPSAAYCVGYVVATNDTLNTIRATLSAPPVVCLPPDVSAGAMADNVTRFLRRHPEMLEVAATTLVMKVLVDSYPCGTLE